MRNLREHDASLRDFSAENGGVGGNRTLDQRIKSPPSQSAHYRVSGRFTSKSGAEKGSKTFG
jgi:hypothetical protein